MKYISLRLVFSSKSDVIQPSYFGLMLPPNTPKKKKEKIIQLYFKPIVYFGNYDLHLGQPIFWVGLYILFNCLYRIMSCLTYSNPAQLLSYSSCCLNIFELQKQHIFTSCLHFSTGKGCFQNTDMLSIFISVFYIIL